MKNSLKLCYRGALSGVMVIKLDEQTIASEFESH